MTLQAQLDEIRSRTRSLVPAAKVAITDRFIEHLRANGAAERALKPGDRAPEFELPDADGVPFRSADALQKGPLVVSFFRGRWCPYCVTELEALEHWMPEFRYAGAAVVAISPQDKRNTDFMREQHKPSFPLLIDAGNRIAREFGVVVSLTPEMRDLYRTIFINLPKVNGDDSWELPLPATFVIAPSGEIIFTFADPDFTLRAETASVLQYTRAAS